MRDKKKRGKSLKSQKKMIDPSSSEEESEEDNIQPLPNERGRHHHPSHGAGRGLEVPNATPR